MQKTSNEKILIISFTNQATDSRVNRQIRFLKDKYKVSTVGLKSAEVDNVIFYPLVRKKDLIFSKIKKAILCKIKRFEKVYWDTYEFYTLVNELWNKKFDIIIANDIESLPFALKIANGAKILLDAHEYTPQEFEDRFLWRFILKDYKVYLCKKYIKHCDKMTTVSDGIANEYYKNFNIKSEIITNACDYVDIEPSPVDDQQITLIHHGAAIPSRNLEFMIEMMDYLDNRFTLYLMLVNTDSNYLKRLKRHAEGKSDIRFLEPVILKEIVKTINQYDVGIFVLPPTNLNNKYALPNKFFDFIQAKLAVVVGPSIEMAGIVEQYDMGIVAENFTPENVAEKLNKLTKDKIEYYKCQSNNAAYELSSERNCQKLQELIAEL